MTHSLAQRPIARGRIALAPLVAAQILTFALAGALAGEAHAEVDTHSKAPIDITADTAEVSNARCVAIWRGSAEAIQENTHLRADTITVYSRPKASVAGSSAPSPSGSGEGQTSCGGADRIEADGHVYYMTPEQNARGDHAVYFQNRDQIVITGDVIVVQGLNVARGSKLTIKVSTHEATMSAATSGAGKINRVRAVFYPDKSNTTSGGDQPASAKP